MDKRLDSMSGGLFLIGMGVLFLVPGLSFWPWILAVIGISSLPSSMAHGKSWAGLQNLIWMVGLAALFASGYFWPGILILIGVGTLLGALTRQNTGSPFSRNSKDSGLSGDDDRPFTLENEDDELAGEDGDEIAGKDSKGVTKKL